MDMTWLEENRLVEMYEASADELKKTHESIIPYMWTIVINISVILAIQKYSVLCNILHIILALGTSITTFVISWPLFMELGFPQ